jgi:outer membrane protein assembly factor BamE (lipoprotein component of BamABCDE complex)
MKLLLLPLLCLVAALTGCSTVSRRIEEKSSYFNTLDAQTQERLKRSAVKVGDTQDMVYIAFGQPDSVREKATSNTHETTWIYNTYRTEYAGTHFVGYHRRVYVNPRTRSRYVAYDPVYATAYRDRTEEYMRVMFRDDRVTAIEQTQE